MSAPYYEICSLGGNAGCAVSALAFDPNEELLWSGLSAGSGGGLSRCVSHHSQYSFANAQRYTAYGTTKSEIRSVLPTSRGVGSVSRNAFMLHDRGGCLVASCLTADADKTLKTGLYSNTTDTNVLASTDASTVVLFDVEKETQVLDANVRHELTVMCQGRYVCGGGLASSTISLLDPRTLKLENQVDVHNAGVLGLDIRGDLVVTCGLIQRMGQPYPVYDSFVRAFDVRTLRSLPPIPFSAGPYLLKFHPKFTSTVCVASSAGQFALCDVQAGAAGVGVVRQVNCGRDPLLSMDVSSSGELIAFGDGSGHSHVWGVREAGKVNLYSRTTPGHPRPPAPSYTIDAHTPLSIAIPPPLPPPPPPGANESKAVAERSKENKKASPPTTTTPTLKLSDHCAEWPDSPLGGIQHSSGVDLSEVLPRLKRVGDLYMGSNPFSGRLHRWYTRDKVPISAPPTPEETPPVPMQPPAAYKRVNIRLGKFGVMDFDFARHNRTHFVGLENILPNTYTNACVHSWYLIPQLRAHVLNHLCDEEHCLTCELAFLFHMMDIGPAQGAVHSGNFLRTLRHKPRSASVHEPSHSSFTRLTYGTLIQRFNRYSLLAMRKEMRMLQDKKTRTAAAGGGDGDGDGPQGNSARGGERARGKTIIDELFGAMFVTKSTCRQCGSIRTRKTFTLDVDASFPMGPGGEDEHPSTESQDASMEESLTFARMLDYSLVGRYDAAAHCSVCQAPKPHMHAFSIASLPNILCVNIPITKPSFRPFWNKKHARAGKTTSNPPWIPSRVQLKFEGPSMRLKVIENPPVDEVENVYKLSCVISHIHDGTTASAKRRSHVVSHNLVEHKHYMPAEGMPPQWYLFNDFRISPTDATDPRQFNVNWKIPCILMLTRIDVEELVPIPPVISPITRDVFDAHTSVPQSGDVVALDAEFVAMHPKSERKRADGSAQVLKPVRLALARVSVILGQSVGSMPPYPSPDPPPSREVDVVQRLTDIAAPARRRERKEKKGLYDPSASKAFIDSYIETKEPIYDYLTRFSGILPGDLTRGISQHHVTSLKAVYLQLRYLADSGVLFVGHGLSKDFRIINIVIPPKQVIDTVDLFRLEGQRMMSLRFLASYLLNVDIQTETHCSVEDSRTALGLYSMYCRLVDEGSFSEAVQLLYEAGRSTAWEGRAVTPSPAKPRGDSRIPSQEDSTDTFDAAAHTSESEYAGMFGGAVGGTSSAAATHAIKTAPFYVPKKQDNNPYSGDSFPNKYCDPHFYPAGY